MGYFGGFTIAPKHPEQLTTPSTSLELLTTKPALIFPHERPTMGVQARIAHCFHKHLNQMKAIPSQQLPWEAQIILYDWKRGIHFLQYVRTTCQTHHTHYIYPVRVKSHRTRLIQIAREKQKMNTSMGAHAKYYKSSAALTLPLTRNSVRWGQYYDKPIYL